LYQAFFSKEYMQAAASFGIALAFDPFNLEQKWNDRPNWQKAVLIAHLALTAAMFGFGIGLNDKKSLFKENQSLLLYFLYFNKGK
jgi:hypothetical protein